jgi:hypothetical protein
MCRSVGPVVGVRVVPARDYVSGVGVNTGRVAGLDRNRARDRRPFGNGTSRMGRAAVTGTTTCRPSNDRVVVIFERCVKRDPR